MVERQLPNPRMMIQTLRRNPPSPLPRQPSLAAAECDSRLGLNHPRRPANHHSTI